MHFVGSSSASLLLTFRGHQAVSAIFHSTWMSIGTSSLRYPRQSLLSYSHRNEMWESFDCFCYSYFSSWFSILPQDIHWLILRSSEIQSSILPSLFRIQSPIQLVWKAFAPLDSTLPLDDRLSWVWSSSLIWVVAIALIWFLCLYSLRISAPLLSPPFC